MNIMDMAEQVSEKCGIEKKQAKAAVQAVFDAMMESAKTGDEVSIAGFGKFKVASREARSGRNPATGETIQIAASKKLAFSPAKQLKDALNPAPAPAAKAKAKPKK